MADDKERAEKLAAARKKAQKKAAEAKAKKGKAATTSKEETPTSPPADGNAPAAAETDKEPEPESTPAAAEEPAPTEEAAPPATAAEPSSSSESTAALEAKLAELEKECADAKSARDEAQLMADALEKKVTSLEMLHKEDESQIKRLETDLAEIKQETVDLKDKLSKSEAEMLRLSKKEAQDSGGTDNDHLDELEDEERLKLEQRIRDLEAENTDLKRGIWQEQRKNMQPSMEDSTGGQFTNVDLGGMSPGAQRRHQGSLVGDFFTSGLNALTGAAGGQQHHDHDDDGFLDDDEDFDEDAFRKAQEEAAKARIERIKEVKRGLKNWEGWRLDLVEGRQGGGEGIGEIFEV